MNEGNNSKPAESFADRTIEGGLPAFLGCLSVGFLGIIAIVFGLYQCSKSDPVETTATATATAAVAVAEPVASPAYSAEQRSMICRAGIAAVFGRDPKTMTAIDTGGGLTHVEYRRPDDNKLWKSDCRLDGDRIVWCGVDAFGDNGPGRWRDGPYDETLTFKLEGRAVTTASSDGSSASETYRF